MINTTISKTEYENLLAENAELKAQISWLIEQLKLSKHKQFCASSEKSDYNQLSLIENREPEISTPEIEEIKAYRRKKSKHSKDRLPPDLPVEIIEHEIPADEQVCPKCDGNLHKMGKETVREELVLIPAKAIIRRHVQHVYSCRNCEKNAVDSVPIAKADIPKPVIKGGFASPESIAHIASQKFVMGIPLYRQEQEWERNGILLSRQTMSNWLIKSALDWLVPIYVRMCDLLLTHSNLHADETTLQVLNEPGKKAQSKSYVWLYRTGSDAKNHIVIYEYQPNRKAENPKKFLKNFKGFLHTDGYDAYHNLPDDITVAGCWAHVRRKFNDALKIIPEPERIGTAAFQGKHFCDCLFALERKFAEMTADERHEARDKKLKPLMEEFFAWCENSRVLPKSPIGQAVSYALDQQKWLKNVLLDGRTELSNNRAERSIKPFLIGRKNWLFSNSVTGADVNAVFYSLVETAKENGLNPFEYLADVFRRAPNGASVDELLPWRD